MSVVATVGAYQLDLTPVGFVVMHDGAPVPPQVYPPAVLAFFSKSDARELAQALDTGDHERAHQVIERGRWWA